MAASLAGTVETADLPVGIELRAFDLRSDEPLRRVVEALDEAFRDHYGHVQGNLDERFEGWEYQIRNDPEYDPELSLVARDGDEIAGACLSAAVFESDTAKAYVNSLGVRRPWRGRGIALALLRGVFRTLLAMGKKGVALHVDSESPTGATRLYEKAGMHVDQLSHEYQLVLREGVDLSTQSLE